MALYRESASREPRGLRNLTFARIEAADCSLLACGAEGEQFPLVADTSSSQHEILLGWSVSAPVTK